MRAGGEEERVLRSGHPAVSERDAPEAVDDHGGAAGVAQLAAVRPGARPPRVDVDAAAAEVSDEEPAGDAACFGRRERDTPRLVQRAHPPDARDEPALENEPVDRTPRRRVI